jgi:hypothetical protein
MSETAEKSGFQEEEEQLLSLVLAEFRAQTHQEIWEPRGKEDDRQHKTVSYIVQQQPPPRVHSLDSRMQDNKTSRRRKRRAGLSGPPLLLRSYNGQARHR